MHELYRKEYSEDTVLGNDFLRQCSVKRFVPRPFRLWLREEKKSVKVAFGRLYFWLITKGKSQVWYLQNGCEIIHTSTVVPKCCKFPFLQVGEYEIGPCVTREDHRGKGIYPYVLNCITASQKGATFYMIVRSTNQSSIQGIKKAGFCRCGTVVKSGIFKTYRKEKEYHD